MTKVSVFGQQPTEPKELKKIEFIKYLNPDGELENTHDAQQPNNWHNVQLFEKGNYNKYDTIIAWDEDVDNQKAIFLGHWNDGIV